jgi:outer membrane protein assembly factor BamB
MQHDMQNTGHSLSSNGPENPALLWKFETGGMVRSSPAIDVNGRIYVGSDDWYLYAINSDGTLAWKFKTRCNLRSSPAIDINNVIYIASGNRDGSTLYAINTDGQSIWEFELTGDASNSSPNIAADGTIYISSWNKTYTMYFLYAVNPDGTLKWKYENTKERSSYYANYFIPETPAIGEDGTIYFTAGSPLCAVNPDGSFNWSYEHVNAQAYKGLSYPSIGYGIAPYQSYNDETIVIGCEEYYFTYITKEGVGMIRHLLYDVHTKTIYSPVTSPSTSLDGFVAFKYSNFTTIRGGNYNATKDTGSYTASSPVIDANNATYFGSGDGYLYSSYGNRGWDNDRWKFQLNGELHSSPAIGDNSTIYIGCDDGYLYAIGNNTLPPPPDKTSVGIYAFKPSYTSGDNLKIEAKIDNAESNNIDFYAAVLIDGRIYFYPGWNNELVPTVIDKSNTITKEIMNIVLPVNSPVGTYTFFAMITKHGTFDLLGFDYITVQIE